jgi:hypothetical protein
MSSLNIYRSLAKVVNSINRSVNRGHEPSSESFQISSSPITKLVEQIDPAARDEMIRTLSAHALQERPSGLEKGLKAQGLLGHHLQEGDNRGIKAIFDNLSSYISDKLARAMKIACDMNKPKLLNYLQAISLKSFIKIPEPLMKDIYSSINAKQNTELYESLVVFEKLSHHSFSLNPELFVKAKTKMIHSDIISSIETNKVEFAIQLLGLASKLDNSYYDHNQDQLGLEIVELKFQNFFADNKFKGSDQIALKVQEMITQLREKADDVDPGSWSS